MNHLLYSSTERMFLQDLKLFKSSIFWMEFNLINGLSASASFLIPSFFQRKKKETLDDVSFEQKRVW